MECNRHTFFDILGHSMPFDPPNNPKSQTFEKMRKKIGDINILHLYITNDDHIMHGSYGKEHKTKFCHFGLFFAILPP